MFLGIGVTVGAFAEEMVAHLEHFFVGDSSAGHIMGTFPGESAGDIYHGVDAAFAAAVLVSPIIVDEICAGS